MSKILRRFRWAVAIGLVAILALSLAVGCSDDDDDSDNGGDETPIADETPMETDDGSAMSDEDSLQELMESTAAAWNAGDVEAFLASFTDAGLMSSFGMPREVAAEELPAFIGDPQITAGTLTNISISEDTATADAADFAFGTVIDANTFTFVREGDAWLIDSEEDLAVEIPEGTTAVDINLLEYQFDFDASQITDGNIAFNVSNVGAEDHEIAIVAVGADDVIEDVIADETFFETADLVGVGGPWPAGTETNMVFTESLESGRYALLCFIEAADGTPHAFLGMVNEFTVQ